MGALGKNILFEKKQQECENLKELFAEIYKEYEDIQKESKYLYHKYSFLFGEANYNKYQSYLLCLRLRRKVEMYQAFINRQENINYVEVEKALEKELEVHIKKLQTIMQDFIGATKYFHLSELSNEEVKEIKHLFYKIAKKIHPDITGEYIEAHKDLWEKSLEAYQNNDLNTLRECAFLLDNLLFNVVQTSALEDIIKKIGNYQTKIKEYKEKVVEIINSFPYNHKQLLFDKKYVEEEILKITEEDLKYQERSEEYLRLLSEMIPTSEKEIC